MTLTLSRLALGGALAAGVLAAAPATAAPTVYNSEASFTAATNGVSFTTLGFEQPFASANTLPFTGVTISCTNCAAGRSSSFPTSGGFSLQINGGNPLTFSFTQPVTAFGFSIRDFGTLSPTSLSLTVNGVTTGLLNNFSGTSGNTLFFGVVDPASFTTATLSGGVSGDNYYLDDVRFGAAAVVTPGAVPEPASWAMMIVGLGAAGGLLRRRRSVAVRAAVAA